MTQRCTRCGLELPMDVLPGHCPQCLVLISFELQPGIGTETEAGECLPRTFGQYELLAEIARGGMGVVYRARQPALKREVALKLTLSGQFASRAAVARFRAEAQAAASLKHPNIVAIHDVGEEEGQPYFTMDLIEGQNLADKVRGGPLPFRKAAQYVLGVAEAIQYAHGRGVLHRDLKPSNVLIDLFDQPHITDFGLAKLLCDDSNLTVTGQTLGSPNYMAPEQALHHQSEIGIASDVYSLGALLYHLAVGRAPFAAGTVAETLQQLIQNEPPRPRVLNPNIPADLETICLKCLEKDPARRYPTGQAVAEELNRFLHDQPIVARPISPIEGLWRWCKRNRSLAALSAASVALFALGLGGVLWQWHRAEQSEYRMRLNLYAADMMAASQAVERGDLGLGRTLLDAHIPQSGDDDLRGFEWRYLWQRCQGQQRATLTGHTWIVTCTAFSPDGALLASGSQDGTVRLWNVGKAGLVTTLRSPASAIWSVCFSPEGDRLVTGCSDGKIRVWDVHTRQAVAEIPGQMAAVAATGSLLAVNSSNPLYWEPAGTVAIWDYRANRKLRELPEPGKGLAISTDGKTLAVAGSSTGIKLLDMASGQLLRAIETEGQTWSLAFSPSGNHLIGGSHRAAYVWNLIEPGAPAKLHHPLTVWSAVFSPNGKTIVTACSDRTVRLWDAASLELKGVRWGHADEVWCAAFAPDGKSLATGSKDKAVNLWSIEPDMTLEQTEHTLFEKPFFSADGSRLITNIRTNDQIRSVLWQVTPHRKLTVVDGRRAVGFHPDGRHLIRLAWERRELELWSPETRSVEKSIPLNLERDEDQMLRVGLSADSKQMFVVEASGQVRVFDTTTGNLQASFLWAIPRDAGPRLITIRSAALTTDGRYFAISTEQEKAVHFFDVRSGRETRLEGHQDFISGLAFSPDDVLLATGSVDATIKLWDVASGKELATVTGHMEEATDVAFSSDGRTLVSLGHLNSVKFWHVATRREIMSLPFSKAGYHLCFSPDGRSLALTLATGNQIEAVQILTAPALTDLQR